MAGKINEIWIGSEHEVEEAFASKRVTVQQCYAVHRADAYVKSMLQQNGLKAPIKIMDEKSMSAMSRQKGTQFWIQVTLSMDETIEDFMEDNEKPIAGVAQLVEQLICNQQVAGSSPITSSILLVLRVSHQ
jgi:tRNA G18 (ribose-2'-O)-methylase SpoU